MLVNGDCQWITTLHYAFQDENNLVIPRSVPSRLSRTCQILPVSAGLGPSFAALVYRERFPVLSGRPAHSPCDRRAQRDLEW